MGDASSENEAAAQNGKPTPSLTIVIPTRNRTAQFVAQLCFFRNCGVRHSFVVADSSDAKEAAGVRAACKGIADYRYFDPATRVIDKLAQVVGTIETPYVVMTPDDDITFPHAIDSALNALVKNPQYAAAHGYVLRFGMHHSFFDIYGVFSFTPTIDDDDPLRRHYQLMRRYQPFIWAVFRTPVFVAALHEAAKVEGAIFQEITFMNTAVLAGKIMRLPQIYSMRGPEGSLTPITEVDPFLWYLNDAGKFFARYFAYRNLLAKNIRAMKTAAPNSATLEQFLDIVHGTWLGRAVNVGVINHMARRLLGDDLPDIARGPEWSGWRPIETSDTAHVSAILPREYVWREAVTAAEPRGEIAISVDEMARVEQQLDFYRQA